MIKYPKLKNALLCRILIYVVVIGGFLVPPLILCAIPQIPDAIGALLLFACAIGLVVYIARNYILLMSIDIMLACIHCNNTARQLFFLPASCKFPKLNKRISSFGKKCEPIQTNPSPLALRYRFKKSWTVYSKGTEEVVAVYRTGFLDKDDYLSIFRSAAAQSKSLTGRQKPLFVEKGQRDSPLLRVTVIVIFAEHVESGFREILYKTICHNAGDGMDNACITCVISEEDRTCVFDSVRLPFMGYSYPVKNCGIRIVCKYVFGGKLPLSNNPYAIETLNTQDADMSLWQFWRMLKNEMVLNERKEKKRFDSMTDRQIIFEDGYLYIKWDKYGLTLQTERNEDTGITYIHPIQSWSYPKTNVISKKSVADMQELIKNYMTGHGYTVRFMTPDEESNGIQGA